MVIDEVERLGEDIRMHLFTKVLDLIKDGLLDQAIMIGFSLDRALPPPDRIAKGTKWFFVEDGTITEIVK